MNKLMVVALLALSTSVAAQSRPELEAEILTYHVAEARSLQAAAVAAIRQDLLDELAAMRWTRSLDLQLRAVDVAGATVGATSVANAVRIDALEIRD